MGRRMGGNMGGGGRKRGKRWGQDGREGKKR